MLDLVHNLQSKLDNGSETRLVSLEFSSAFDLASHSALSYKLESFGISGRLLSVLKEFLSGRHQRVSVDGQMSDFVPVLSGVPQGSVLGPLLFILYTADLGHNLDNKLVVYADDTTLYSAVDSPRERAAVARSLNGDLAKIQSWCQQWGMKLNPSKTQSIIVSRSRTINPIHPPLLLCGLSIPVSSKVAGCDN